jgi:divalent metal cation (Fe/Co/Zn/Cd) transporter
MVKYVESNFKVRVEKILLRPAGIDFYAQVHVELDKGMSLEQANDILTRIRASVIKEFETEDAIVIPKPV